MGYPCDQATMQAEEDRLKLKDPNEPVKQLMGDQNKTKRQTKEEQDELLSKGL